MEYLQPTIGLFALLALGAIFSEDIKSIKIRYVVSGVLIQLVLAILLTKVEIISSFSVSYTHLTLPTTPYV